MIKKENQYPILNMVLKWDNAKPSIQAATTKVACLRVK